MVVDPLAKLLPIALHAGNGINRTAANLFATGPTQADSPNIPPAASFSHTLQQVEKQNASACKRVTS